MTQIRDMERIRELLLDIKNGEDETFRLIQDPHDRYQFYLMRDAGLLEYTHHPKGDNLVGYLNVKITSYGHDFIDAFENKENFEGTKKFARDRGQELLKLPFDIMIGLGKQYIKQQLGI